MTIFWLAISCKIASTLTYVLNDRIRRVISPPESGELLMIFDPPNYNHELTYTTADHLSGPA